MGQKVTLSNRSQKVPYPISCVGWMDLLGYGSMLEKVGFDPSASEAKVAVRRLRDFHQTIISSAHSRFPVMPINDGAIFFRDLSLKSTSVTFDFLRRAIDLHAQINAQEKASGHPGARLVIAAGFRMLGAAVRMPPGYKDNILSRLRSKTIDSEQAVQEAFQSRPIAGFVPQLQANFAFTKAYLVDHAGTKGGFPSSHCYIDLALFDTPPSAWIRMEKTVKWADRGMSANFGKVASYDWKEAGKCSHRGILQVSEIKDRL